MGYHQGMANTTSPRPADKMIHDGYATRYMRTAAKRIRRRLNTPGVLVSETQRQFCEAVEKIAK